MRLLVLTQYFWPEPFRINDLVSELVARGHQVTVLTGWPNYPNGNIFPEYRANPSAFRTYHGAEVVRVPLFPRGKGAVRLLLNYLSFAVSASLLGLWCLRGRRFDAIFVYEPSPITVGIPAAVLRAWKRAPVAFWVLDIWPDTLEALGVVRSRWLLGAVDRLVGWIYRRCDLILAQSRGFIPQILRLCPETAKVCYFPSWAEAVFGTAGCVIAPEVDHRPDLFNIVFAGNIGDAQDFPAILAAAEALREELRIRWLIVGDGRMAAWVAEEVQRRDLSDTVKLLGRYPVERMPSFYGHADALLLSLKDAPIFAMTIPAKLQTYLAAGRPVLAMINGEGADVVVRAGAGLVCPAGDSIALAAAVRRLIAMSPADRKAMGERGRQCSEEEFGREKLVGQLEGWLAELGSGRASAHRRGESNV